MGVVFHISEPLLSSQDLTTILNHTYITKLIPELHNLEKYHQF